LLITPSEEAASCGFRQGDPTHRPHGLIYLGESPPGLLTAEPIRASHQSLMI